MPAQLQPEPCLAGMTEEPLHSFTDPLQAAVGRTTCHPMALGRGASEIWCYMWPWSLEPKSHDMADDFIATKIFSLSFS